MEVNIYFATTAKAPKNRVVGYAYVLECITGKGPATMTKGGILENISAHEADISILNDALTRVKEGTGVNIYTESDYIAKAIKEWIPEWQQNSWRNARGEEVSLKWQETANLLRLRPLLSIQTKQIHEYRSWLNTEAKKARENADFRGRERQNQSQH